MLESAVGNCGDGSARTHERRLPCARECLLGCFGSDGRSEVLLQRLRWGRSHTEGTKLLTLAGTAASGRTAGVRIRGASEPLRARLRIRSGTDASPS